MQIADTVKRLSYSPFMGACIRRLGLRKIMQRAYAAVQGNPSSAKFSLGEIAAVFCARTPHELRCVEGTWFSEQGMLPKLLSSIRVGDVFLDAGANLGMFSVFVAERVGPNGLVFAFEPESVAHERLLENIRINKLTNVRPFKMALSQESGNRHLAIGDPEGVSQSSHLSDEGFGFEVESADFDSFAAKNNLPIPQVVKMDIEGHEYAALQGMKKTLANPACRSIFCEVHPCVLPRGVMAKDVAALIRSFGFHSLSVDERFEQFHISATKT